MLEVRGMGLVLSGEVWIQEAESEGRVRETVSPKANGLGRPGWSLSLRQSPLENQEESGCICERPLAPSQCRRSLVLD